MKISNEEHLSRFLKVNSCKTLEDLAKVILSFADENGQITGREKSFLAEQMANRCAFYASSSYNTLTRNWGIRQQAMYIISKPS